jgi:hypothetical protein
VQYRKDEYEQIVASQRGDSFHIKWEFYLPISLLVFGLQCHVDFSPQHAGLF